MRRRLGKTEMELLNTKVKAEEDKKLLVQKHREVSELKSELSKHQADLVRCLQQHKFDQEQLCRENKSVEASREALRCKLDIMEKELTKVKQESRSLKEEVVKLGKELQAKEELVQFYKQRSTKCDATLKLQELSLMVICKKML